MRIFFTICFAFIFTISDAQNSFSGIIKNDSTKETIAGATIAISGKSISISKQDGSFLIGGLEKKNYKLTISHTGFVTINFDVFIPATDTAMIIYLQPKQEEMEEVFVSSFRTNSRIEDLPTKVEVLGSEEVAEENGIKPGNIASLLGDVAGIQIQQTNAATGNADARCRAYRVSILNY